ncbi:class C sortase [Vagococcus salmoninarum]|uniref:Class C sortase n=1 Tax=Vagococcus salmoninarum TaxID=2739 RepID=A0A429ZIP5_9ENTE|nr:class C sortase [Vagococcus salmoninarum]RST93557.1 hypothetical protein CBF35_11765 [Vagococcus salmoninarum]
MKIASRRVLIMVLLIIGVSLILFPVVSNLYNYVTATKVIDTYQKEVKATSKAKKKQLKKEMSQYNKELAAGTETVTDPFKSTEQGKEPAAKVSVYDNLAEELGEVLGEVTIPKIDVKLPIYNGTSELQLKKGAGLLKGTSLPVGGEGTHSVISAHRGLPTAKLFTDLPKLAIGDVFYIETLEETLAYRVDQIKVVKPENVEDIRVNSQADYFTLLTCTPYMVNTDRLLVRGERIPYTAEVKKSLKKASQRQRWLPIIKSLLLIIGVIGLVICYYLWQRRRSSQKAKSN